ncbi:MAG: OmpA family protein [Hydrogenophaga sp.]|nr:OmpA family protein [Hydrogenophaga sp.]
MSSQDEEQEGRIVAAVLIAALVLVVGLVVGVAVQKARSFAGMKSTPAAAAAAAPAGEGHAAEGHAMAGHESEGASAAAGSATGAGDAGAANAGASSEASAAATADKDDASVVVENGVVKFYFASGKADLAPGAVEALGDAIAAGKAGKKLVLSGFHDATGDPAKNAELAKKRAFAVRDALKAAGVAESGIELKKPEQTTGSGNNAEARRVEVMISQ